VTFATLPWQLAQVEYASSAPRKSRIPVPGALWPTWQLLHALVKTMPGSVYGNPEGTLTLFDAMA